jgi:hypothetical protein
MTVWARLGKTNLHTEECNTLQNRDLGHKLVEKDKTEILHQSRKISKKTLAFVSLSL